VLLAAGCATMGFGSYYDRGANFAVYRTYDWGPADALPTGDPRLDHNAFFIDHFEGAVNKALAVRGLERVETGVTPDLLVHHHASVTQRVFVSDFGRRIGRFGRIDQCSEDGCGPRTEVFDVATFTIDIVDARTKRLVWRGWAEDTIAGALADQDRLERLINEAVTGMIGRLPRPLVRPTTAG
jgi:hypothetical protein